MEELKVVIAEAWEDLDIIVLKNLISNMPNRIYEVINKNGGDTSY